MLTGACCYNSIVIAGELSGQVVYTILMYFRWTERWTEAPLAGTPRNPNENWVDWRGKLMEFLSFLGSCNHSISQLKVRPAFEVKAKTTICF